MTLVESSNGLLGVLPQAVRGRMTLRIVTADGEISRPVGDDDGSRVRVRTGGLVVEPGEGRSVFQHRLADSGSTAVMSIDSADEEAVVPFRNFYASEPDTLTLEEKIGQIHGFADTVIHKTR